MAEDQGVLADELIAGIIMNIVAQEERHVARELALEGRDLAAPDAADEVYRRTVDNVIKRFPGKVGPHVRKMLANRGLRDAIAADLARIQGAPWLVT